MTTPQPNPPSPKPFDEEVLDIGGVMPRAYGVARILTLTGIAKQEKIVGAEIGVWAGRLSAELLKAMPALRLFMVDAWRPAPEGSASWKADEPGARDPPEKHLERKEMATRVTEFARFRRKIVHATSREAAGRVADGELDFAFIDASHVREAVLEDLALWSPKVRRFGVLGGHDLDHPLTCRGAAAFDVRGAIEAHARETGEPTRLYLGPDTTWFFIRG